VAPSELRLLERPALERPVLIAAFQGWNDGGQGATLAVSHLRSLWSARRFAEIDPEGFLDFQATRPQVRLVDGVVRRIEWPENAFFHASPAELGRGAVLLHGVEPSLRWRTFSGLVVDLARDLGVELVVTLGALLADVPHTRPAPVTGTASDPALAERLGLQVPRYEGPTGIVGVLDEACRRAGLAAVMLWAAVPHYVSLAPSPRAALALCGRLAALLEAPIDTSALEAMVPQYTRQVSEAVAADEETAAYVEELERQADLLVESDLPSGEALAAELTRYLREREKRGDGPPEGARGP
jgi:proteasome assembly chaperone (PAC2) family protein